MEPFSNVSLQIKLVWIVATTTKICTRGCFRQVYTCPFSLQKILRALLHVFLTNKKTAEHRQHTKRLSASIFGADRFGRWVVTHSLAGDDFHVHRPAVCIEQHPLWDLGERLLGRLGSAFGSSRIASSAYQKWPTCCDLYSYWKFKTKKQPMCAHLKFENRPRRTSLPDVNKPLIIRFTRRNYHTHTTAILGETSEGTSY